MARYYSRPDIKVLWGLAAARCAFPGCRRELVQTATEADSAAVIGKQAHIVAHSDDGPRADPSSPRENRDKYENLVLLCGTHHDVVDVQPNTYAVADLSRWKAEHEKWVYDSLVEAVTQVQFTELEMVTKTLLRVPGQSAATFTVTAPLEKMRRNGLTEQIGLLLAMGLANAHVVEKFVASFAAVDPNFPEALKGGFVHEYNLLVEAGTRYCQMLWMGEVRRRFPEPSIHP